MPPATAPTPAPTAAPTGPPTIAPVTAPVVAPAAAPSWACAASGNESAAAMLMPASNLVFMKSSGVCVFPCGVRNEERQRRTAVPNRIQFLSGTFFAFQHFPVIEFKMPGGFMEQVMRPVGVVDEVVEPSVAGVSWAAVVAGAVTSCALTLLLLAFGAGVGFSVVSPWNNSGVSATTFEIGTGLYFVVMAMISSALGGYLAGRLRNRWIGVPTTEVHFRDTAHGFLAWALASVLGAILLASPATSLLGGATSGAVQAASSSQATGPMDGYVDTLLRPANPTAENTGNSANTRQELARLFTADFRHGAEPSAADRSY